MNQLILHPQTRKNIEQLVENLPHAVMLTGNEGSGKLFTALMLAEQILDESLENHPYFIHIAPDGKSFTIDQTRQLQKTMKLKTTGTNKIRRVAVLENVHTMTVEAQNALLKLLEEPPEDTVLILTAAGDSSLKATIYSRVQRVHIKPVPISELSLEMKKHAEISKLYSLSGGDIGLLSALLNENSEHPLVSAIDEAKNIITEPVFKRLVRVDQLGKDKEKMTSLLAAIKRIAKAALKASILKQDKKGSERWAKILEQTYHSEELLHTNVGTKLLLTELFLAF